MIESFALTGPAATVLLESEGARAAAVNVTGTTSEVNKFTHVRNELFFDELNILEGLKNQLASVVLMNFDAFTGSSNDLGHTDLFVDQIFT